MKKRLIICVLAAVLLLTALAPGARALQTNIASGTCGENISWSLDGYTLTISGSGEMAEGSPWSEHKDHIEDIVFTGGVTKICDEAFSGYDRVKTVDFGDALVEIGKRAFYGCDKITYIHLPATFRIFGSESFRDCTSLKSVYCDGGMPRFNDSCLWTGDYISVFYPGNNPWPQEYVSQLVSNFGGRLTIAMGSFDPSAVTAASESQETEAAEQADARAEEETAGAIEAAATEAPTLPATVPETVPATEAPTIPATEAPTAPATEAPTVPTTQATVPVTEAPTEPFFLTEPTEPQTVVQKVGGSGWIGMVIVAAVLTLLLIGALIFRSSSHKGGKYTE